MHDPIQKACQHYTNAAITLNMMLSGGRKRFEELLSRSAAIRDELVEIQKLEKAGNFEKLARKKELLEAVKTVDQEINKFQQPFGTKVAGKIQCSETPDVRKKTFEYAKTTFGVLKGLLEGTVSEIIK